MSDDRPRIHVFYDYVCPYAYVGFERAQRLVQRFDLEVVWLPWEIHPTTAPAGEPLPASKRGPGWADRLAEELGLRLGDPQVASNSNLALRGAECAKDKGEKTFERYHRLAFEAAWKHGRNLGEEAVLRALAQESGMDGEGFLTTIRHHAYQERLNEVDQLATRAGVQRVPTFVFGDQRIVGNDAFEPSLVRPLEAFLERWKALGPEGASTLAEDAGFHILD